MLQIRACVYWMNGPVLLAVEVDGLLGVEEHGLLGVYLDDEVLEGAKANHVIELLTLRLGDIGQLAAFLGGFLRLFVHALDEVVGVYHRSLAGFHLAFRELHHPTTYTWESRL